MEPKVAAGRADETWVSAEGESLSYTNGVGTSLNPFAPETAATSGASATAGPAQVSPNHAGVSGSAVSVSADRTKLSAFGGALAQAMSESDVRMDKVSALQQDISGGTYRVSASDVAGKIVDSLLM